MKTERKTKGYTEESVLLDLRKKNDVRIIGKQIQELMVDSPARKGDVGNTTKGKLDFLTKFCGYSHFFVKEFKK